MIVYRSKKIATLPLSFALIVMLSIAAYMTVLSVRTLVPVYYVVSGLSWLLVLLLLRGRLLRPAVRVDDQGICAIIFGFRTREIAWKTVSKIRKDRISNGYTYVESFHVFDNRSQSWLCTYFVNTCGAIAFSADIQQLKELLQSVTAFSRLYNFKLTVRDAEFAARALQTNSGSEYWKRAFGKIEEVEVLEF